MSGRNERSAFITDRQRRQIPHGLFDTHCVWRSKPRILRKLFPAARLIACVRHVPWIIDSIEQRIRRNAIQLTSNSGDAMCARSEGLANGDGLLGSACNTPKEAHYGEDTANRTLPRHEPLVDDLARADGDLRAHRRPGV